MLLLKLIKTDGKLESLYLLEHLTEFARLSRP